MISTLASDRRKRLASANTAEEQTEQNSVSTETQGYLEALNKSMAVIEFELDGTIISANDNFLNTVGYRLEEIQGQHHRIFCESELVQSPEYSQFWDRLRRGESHSGEFKRLNKQGEEIWIRASYNLIKDDEGTPC